MNSRHLISIVGAGPGDPELLTVKALDRLQKADVVLHDALIGTEMLSLSGAKSELIYVGKLYDDGQDQTKRQEFINAKIKELAHQDKRIVRLKAGDPMIFGRGAEELEFCLKNNLQVEVIPGITAGFAAASIFGIPITLRGKTAMCLLYTGHRQNGGFSDIESLIPVLNSGSPVIVYMGLTNLPNLAEELINLGVSEDFCVQISSKISQKGQRNFSTRLGQVNQFFETEKPEMPALIVIGKYAESLLGETG